MHHDARRTVQIGAFLAFALASRGVPAQDKPPAPPLAADRLAAIDRISSDSLKGHLSFIASDLLEGRDTPSKGLDLAAEYIAAQFRRAGLEPVGDDGYFQTANWESVEPDTTSFRFELASDGKTISIDRDNVILLRAGGLDVLPTAVYKADLKTLAQLDPEQIAGKVVLVEVPTFANPGAGDPVVAQIRGGLAMLGQSKAAFVVSINKRPRPAANPGGLLGGVGNRRLLDPKVPRSEPIERPGPPQVTVYDSKLADLFDALPLGANPAVASLHLGAPIHKAVKLRNVAGLLRGSDPALKDTCVMVTAHYDHVGVRGPEGTDRIYNGANDDGSGTVSVIELASALGSLKERPKRSILFVTFFGEEKGLLGSRYYGKNPIFPVEKTVADVNLEQVGRTDDTEGPQVGAACLTGFGYSDVSKVFVAAGEAEGVKVYRHPRNSDAYFGRSDNQALADLGVPAHTLCVAFQYPDYHGPADHWDKVDYANMAKVDRMVARALLTLADDPNEPKWDESNPRAAKYLKAWKDRRAN
jgi:Peptidase family M28